MAYTYWKPDAAAFYADPNLDAGVVLSGSTITDLVDLSGNSADFVQHNSDGLPLRVDKSGVKWADWPGDAVMVGPTATGLGIVIDVTEDARISCVVEWDVAGAASDRVWTTYDGAGSTQGRLRYERIQGEMQATWGNSVYGDAVSTGTPYIVQVEKVGTNLDLIVNGSVAGSVAVAAKLYTAGELLSIAMSIGGFVNSSDALTDPFDGQTGGMVIEVDSFLDDTKLYDWLTGWKNGTLVDGALQEGFPDPPEPETGRPLLMPPLVFSPVIAPAGSG